MDKKNILLSSYKEILEDNKLIRLAALTTFIYSLIFVVYVMYHVYYFFADSADQREEVFQISMEYIEFIMANIEFLGIAIGWIITVAIWYFLLPPIADWAMITYVNSVHKSASKSLANWLYNFFTMFEYHALTSVVKFLIYFIAVSRLYVIWVLDNIIVQIVVGIRTLLIFFTSLFFHYSRFLIILEGYWSLESIKKSIILSLQNFRITLKFVLINYLLYLRFFLNIIIIVVVPLTFVWLVNRLWVYDEWFVRYILYILFWILILIVAYINAIIEAFFISYWHKVYETVKQDELDSWENISNNQEEN